MSKLMTNGEVTVKTERVQGFITNVILKIKDISSEMFNKEVHIDPEQHFNDKLVTDVQEAFHRYQTSLQVYECVENLIPMDTNGPREAIIEKYYHDMKDEEANYMRLLNRAKRYNVKK